MKQWFTTTELAELALAGLPASRDGITKLSNRENWADNFALCRNRPGREGGGGLEYHIDQLPMVARLDYLSRQVVVDIKDIAAGRDDIDHEPCSAVEMTERDARLAIVAIVNRFRRDSGFTASGADDWFCRLVKSGSIELPGWISAVIKVMSPRSISRWRSIKARGEAEKLAFDRSKNRGGTGILDRAENGDIRNFILAHLANNPHLAAKHIRLAVWGAYGDQLVVDNKSRNLPPLRTFQNTLKGWKKTYRNELMRLSDPDAYKSSVRYVVTGATVADRLNECWEIDASTLDLMCTDGRVNIYVAVDIYSRRSIIHMTQTPRAIGVGELIRKCINKWGVAELIKTDNGSDFKANATQRLLSALGIEVDYCDAYSPEQKGVVERLIKTFQHDIPVILPGYIGHCVADRKRIEGQRSFANRLGMDDDKIFNVSMSMAEVQEIADYWADKVYGGSVHSTIGSTPNKRAALAEGSVRRLKHVEALDILLAPLVGQDGMRRVTKAGIRANNTHYLIGSVMPGAQVFCRFDPTDAGKLYVFEPDGETFIGHALNWELAGIDPAELAGRVRAQQKAREDETITHIRPHRRQIKQDQLAIVNAMRRESFENEPNLVAFPKPEEAHETPQIAAAADAAETPATRPVKTAKIVRLADSESDWDRYRRATSLQARIDAGKAISDAERIWLSGYQAGPEYSSLAKMIEDFGEQVMR